MASHRYEIGVGLLLLTAGAAAAFMALQVGALDAWGQDRIRLTVPMVDAAGLKAADEVTIAGVSVGQIEALGVDGSRAVATLSVDRAAGIRADAVVRVRQRSLLGEKYLEVEPGSGAPLDDGGQLAPVGPQMEIDEVIAAIAPVLQALDPEDVALALDALGRAIAEDPDRVGRMLANADRLVANAATASDELPSLLEDGRAAMSQVRSTTGSASRALAAVEARAGEARSVIARADNVLGQVESADPGALVTDSRAAVADVREVVATLDGSTGDLQGILDTLSEIDREELVRMLREEGVLIRLFPKKQRKE